MRLMWHPYQYYPYERELASREVISLLNGPRIKEIPEGIELVDDVEPERAERLTYFSQLANGHGLTETVQARLERAAGSAKKRQATRYSVHGLHEYKGKFNPQIVRALLNIFSIEPGQRILDPFCGSGTTLVECAHVGAIGFGTDLNPLAVYVANAKLLALRTPVARLRKVVHELSEKVARKKAWRPNLPANEKTSYLKLWFDLPILQRVEIIGQMITEMAGPHAPIFLVIASNLLRDYSLQDPNDLRIRRRSSPLPSVPFETAFLNACAQMLDRLEATQLLLGTDLEIGKSQLQDITNLDGRKLSFRFDAAITSPPYATALPYIDTQRLSLVWLDLVEPRQILALEAKLIGSREFRSGDRRSLLEKLETNADLLPKPEAEYCLRLARALSSDDGFRRQGVPSLLYRYFANMQRAFVSVRSVVKRNGKFALVVGHNHTTLGGKRFDIDTPHHLASIAASCGWKIDELIPLQTYRRYGYHVENAVAAETLLILSNSFSSKSPRRGQTSG